jgi:site-specific DNA recombinase
MNPVTAEAPALRRIAVYQRVSSDTQRERETIKTQSEALERATSAATDIKVIKVYTDDGVSGTIPFARRPAGAELLRDASLGLFDELWVYRFDRVGRDEVDALVLRRDLQELGVTIYSTCEGEAKRVNFGLHMLMAAEGREAFLINCANGTDRAAREGRYCGGIVPYGYQVQGHKQTARLVPAREQLPGCLLSEAEVITHIYTRLGVDGWSCRSIASELTALGIPTRYQLDGRGHRGKATQGRWGAGRIRNMAVSPIYYGLLQYGRRSAKSRDLIEAQVPPLVGKELWDAAQETLEHNRLCPKNTERIYLLRGVIRCGNCGRTYAGSLHRGEPWYRCGGTLQRSELVGERCQAKLLRGDILHTVVWEDIEAFLRNPGDVLSELESEAEGDPVRESLVKERVRWEKAKTEWEAKRERLLQLFEAGYRTKAEVDERLIPIMSALSQAIERLKALDEQERDLAPVPVSLDLLEQIRAQLDEGLSDEKRAEIVRLLVHRITVFTDMAENGKKTQRIVIEYLFPRVSATGTPRGS